MLLHERLEEAAGLIRIFRNILLQRRGNRYRTRIGHRVGGGDHNTQSKSFDVTIKLPRQKERGFQCRIHEIMLFGGDEDGFEFHGDLRSNPVHDGRTFAEYAAAVLKRPSPAYTAIAPAVPADADDL